MTFVATAVALLACTNVHAETNVLLFGVLDEGINFTNNAGGHKAYQMTSNDLVTSRWGLKGTEDLGSGLSAIFDLESGFNMENGTAAYGGRLFGISHMSDLCRSSLGV